MPMKAKQAAHPAHPHLSRVVERNINTLLEVRRQIDRKRSYTQRVADKFTTFSGSLPFLYLNIAIFGAWLLINTGAIPFLAAFDPYPFGLLTTIVSLEAIMLAILVLVTQNRLADLAEQRAELDLQINILTEYEVTKTLRLVDAIADHLGLKEGMDAELDDLKREIQPIDVLRAIEVHRKKYGLRTNGELAESR